MTPAALDVLARIAARLRLDTRAIGRPHLCDLAIREALVTAPPSALVEFVAGLGALGPAQEPWGVVLHRLRQAPEVFATRHGGQCHGAPEGRGEVRPADRAYVEREPVCMTREPVGDGVNWGALVEFV